jgi:hypothetical protein
MENEQLTDNELEGLATMLLAYGELTKSINALKAEWINKGAERANLNFVIERERDCRTFIPTLNIYERVMKSKQRLSPEYQEQLANIKEVFVYEIRNKIR